MNMLLCVLGVAFFAGAAYGQEHTIVLPLCDDSYCYDTVGDCQPPNTVGHGSLENYNAPVGDSRTECFCFCGKTAGQNCTMDEQCIEGHACVITQAHAQNTVGSVTHGLCTNKCALREALAPWEGGCSPYEKCSLVGKEPVCRTRLYKCDSKVTDMTVEGEREVNGAKSSEFFNSPCDMFVANHELQEINPTVAEEALFQVKRFLSNSN